MTRYFLDTEFNGMGGKLLTLAMVCEDGRELYLATLHHDETVDGWVLENVVPVVSSIGAMPKYVNHDQFGASIYEFLKDDPMPSIMADWPDDIAYFCKAIIVGPGKVINLQRLQFYWVRIDAYPTSLPGAVQHNALWDARALRHAFMGRNNR